MAESVALSKKTQKSFSSSVKNYKKLLKKGEIKITEKTTSLKKNKPFKSTRGLVYLGNIPHGFYEEGMMEYFGQFGDVTRLRLARSKKSGKSKGFAFIEFKVPEVAKIVAETMDRYLMGKRLLKAQYIAPEEQKINYFKGKAVTENRYAKKTNRIRNTKNVNAEISEAKEAAACKRMLKQVEKVQKQLKSVGIQYDFKPVDMPEFLKLDPVIEDTDEDDKSDMESDDSDDIVFQPPIKTMSKRKTTPATATVPPKTKSFKKKKQTGNNTQEKEKVKLTGIAKKTLKSKKPKSTEPIESKKGNMIKNQILNSDQVKMKSAKDLKANKKQENNKSPKGKKGKKAKK